MSKYPHLTAHLANRKLDDRIGGFEKACQTALDAVAAKHIANPVYNDIKSIINGVLGDAYDEAKYPTLVAHNKLTAAQSTAQDEIYYTTPMLLHTAPKLLAKVEKMECDLSMKQAALTILREIAPVADAMNALKANGWIVKRQPKSAEEKNQRFVAPQASSNAAKRIKALLVGLMAENFADLATAIGRGYQTQVDQFIRAQAKTAALGNPPLSLRVYARDFAPGTDLNHRNVLKPDTYFLSKVVDEDGNRVATLKSDYPAILADIAHKDAEDIRDAFIAKNLRKIVSVVDAKGQDGVGLSDAIVLGRSVSLTGFEGSFRVTFADGSGFQFTNSVVWSHSVHNLPFLRYPLRFHNVVLPGGAKMPRPSEERMNTVFLGKEV